MPKLTTRHKIRRQAINAWENMSRAQNNLAGVMAISDGRHPGVEEHVPTISAALESVMQALERFNEGL